MTTLIRGRGDRVPEFMVVRADRPNDVGAEVYGGRTFDELALYAAARYGSPSQCRGSVTAEFDGMKFGSLVLRFGDNSVFTVETQPPESSTVTLRVASGFVDPESAREALRAYAFEVGLDIDWTTPEVTREQDERVETFWDPASGLNGSASFVFSGDALVALRFSLGL